MKILSINNSNYYQKNIQNNNLVSKELQNSQYPINKYEEVLGRSLVNFRGAEFIFNKNDKAFIEIIAKEFGLVKEQITLLKRTVSDFLKQNNIKSLSEIGGEKFIDAQSTLAEKIDSYLNLDDKKYEYLVGEIVNRCDSGDDYVPSTFQQLEDRTEMVENMIKLVRDTNPDLPFMSIISYNLDFSAEQSSIFETVIKDYLLENRLKSLKDLNGMDKIDVQAELVCKINDKLDLTDFQMGIIAQELVNWMSHNAEEYTPITTHLDKDFEMLDGICTKYSIDLDTKVKLFNIMRQDAYNNGYRNIFEIFKNNYTETETYKFLTSQKEQDLYTDLSIELASLSKLDKRENFKLEKHAVQDVIISAIKDAVILNKLQVEFAFSQEQIDVISKKIIQRHPSSIDGGCDMDVRQIAFEIADKYQLESGAESKIINIINECDDKSFEI